MIQEHVIVIVITVIVMVITVIVLSFLAVHYCLHGFSDDTRIPQGWRAFHSRSCTETAYRSNAIETAIIERTRDIPTDGEKKQKKKKNEWKTAKINKPKITVFPTYLFDMTDGQTKVYTSHDICSTEIMCACGVTSDLHGSVGMQTAFSAWYRRFFSPPALQSVTMS